jgi:hypothetical protein
MSKINFKKEWREIYFKLNHNKPNKNSPRDYIRLREFLLYAEVNLAKAEVSYYNKDQINFNFYFELYLVTMKNFSFMISHK